MIREGLGSGAQITREQGWGLGLGLGILFGLQKRKDMLPFVTIGMNLKDSVK